MSKSHNTLWVLVGGLFLLLAAVAAYKAWPVLFPKVARTASVDTNCDLRAGPCRSDLPGGGTISFGISPEEIPLVSPLQFQVDIDGLDARSVEVDFQGVDMNMGFNRVKLEQQSAGRFTGGGMLPVCVRDAMEWELSIRMAEIGREIAIRKLIGDKKWARLVQAMQRLAERQTQAASPAAAASAGTEAARLDDQTWQKLTTEERTRAQTLLRELNALKERASER